jgi:hypothetical protein
MTQASRVDQEEPELEINKLRNQLFSLLRRAVAESLPAAEAENLTLAYTRIFFYTLHGIVGTYQTSSEPLEQLLDRLDLTFDLSVDVLLTGFKKNREGELVRDEV